MITHILMQFYDGGELADYKVVKCNEDELYDYYVKFKQKCVRANLGTRIGILDEDELDNILKELNKKGE